MAGFADFESGKMDMSKIGKSITLAGAALMLACSASGAMADAGATDTGGAAQPSIYADTSRWLCLPGREDICHADMTTTVVNADGSTLIEAFTPPGDTPIDCFYIYPTLSLDKSGNADWEPGPEEARVLEQQLVRFADVCRVYAPAYRQITLEGTFGRHGPIVPLYRTAIADVRAAWSYYLDNYNEGRGVILIGHSQGSRMLTDLIANTIEGSPAEGQIVSAYLNGTSVLVPEGEVVGGSFKSMPLCESATQTGCIVAYRSFRDTVGPVNAYAATSEAGMELACVNPAALHGGPAPLHSYLSNGSIMGGPVPSFFSDGRNVETPFASVPGLLEGECLSNDKGQYLTIRINADPDDPRTDDITGDIYTRGEINPAMGLHLIDVNLVMGNLLDLARSQTQAYLDERASQ